MATLVLLRHGESTWNRENRFTGWTDVDLTERGVAEARRAGQQLEQEGLRFDVAYTSVLKRAIRSLWIVLDELDQMWIPVHRSWRLNERHYGALQGLNKTETAQKYGDQQVLVRTLWIVLDELDQMWIPVHRSWRLNERHYGALQGLNKTETAQKYGDQQVLEWRRSYDKPPPILDINDERFPGRDPRYADLNSRDIPRTECLADTVARFLPYWRETIAPQVVAGKRVIVAAHGNSLRALVKYLDDVSDEDIVSLDIPTGVPLVYELDDALKPVRSRYLGDPDE